MSSSFNGNNGNTNSGRQCVSTSNVDLVPTQSGSNGSQLSPRKSNIDVIEPSPNKNGERYDFTISVNPKNPGLYLILLMLFRSYGIACMDETQTV